jgi:hypothetical protein
VKIVRLQETKKADTTQEPAEGSEFICCVELFVRLRTARCSPVQLVSVRAFSAGHCGKRSQSGIEEERKPPTGSSCASEGGCW